MSGRQILLLRHGRTSWNVEQRFQGRDHPADPPLDEVGVGQAERAAAAVVILAPSLILASDARRARQTATTVAAATGLPVSYDPRLREQAFGRWEGLTYDEVCQRYPLEYQAWRRGEDPLRPAGESRAEVAERVAAAVAEVPDNVRALLVTHGATAGVLIGRLLGMPPAPRRITGLHNCHWSELAESGSGWTLRAHNCSSATAPLAS